jgi:hypothetical protein
MSEHEIKMGPGKGQEYTDLSECLYMSNYV